MNVNVMTHPLIQHKVTLIRSIDTGTKDFRQLLEEIALLMGYEITRDLPLEDVEVETPLVKAIGKQIAGKKIGYCPYSSCWLRYGEWFVGINANGKSRSCRYVS